LPGTYEVVALHAATPSQPPLELAALTVQVNEVLPVAPLESVAVTVVL
jgi:hypothetical protein